MRLQLSGDMVITLTTDWGDDYFAGMVKGVIMRYQPDTVLVDLSHRIPAFNLAQAAYCVRNAFSFFPPGSIHLIGVGNDATRRSPHLVVLYQGHYFLGTGNEVFDLLCDEPPEAAFQISAFDAVEMPSFPALSVLVPAAVHIMRGKPIEALGAPRDMDRCTNPLLPTYDLSVITGVVMYIDSFGNAVTNVTRSLFHQVGRDRDFVIYVQSNHYRISEISRRYSEVESGNLVALFNASNMLELAVNHGNLSELLGLRLDSHIRIKFSDPPDAASGTLFTVF